MLGSAKSGNGECTHLRRHAGEKQNPYPHNPSQQYYTGRLQHACEPSPTMNAYRIVQWEGIEPERNENWATKHQELHLRDLGILVLPSLPCSI